MQLVQSNSTSLVYRFPRTTIASIAPLNRILVAFSRPTPSLRVATCSIWLLTLESGPPISTRHSPQPYQRDHAESKSEHRIRQVRDNQKKYCSFRNYG